MVYFRYIVSPLTPSFLGWPITQIIVLVRILLKFFGVKAGLSGRFVEGRWWVADLAVIVFVHKTSLENIQLVEFASTAAEKRSTTYGAHEYEVLLIYVYIYYIPVPGLCTSKYANKGAFSRV